MSSPSKPDSGCLILCGGLAAVFITLKLLGVIAWYWLWVLSPIWIPFAIAIILVILFLLNE